MISNYLTNQKYLSVLIDRFFSRYQLEEYPDFVEFVKQWMEYSEETYVDDNGNTKISFWRTLSNLENFIDIERVPNELLLTFLDHYAENFKYHIENIPFFVEWEINDVGQRTRRLDEKYGKIIYKYNNIRYFLKNSRKFFNSKGNYNSYLYMFKMFGGKCTIFPLEKCILKSSDKQSVLSSKNNNYNKLYHIHGVDTVSKDRDWWYSYYSYRLETDLDEELYKPIILDLIHPSGTHCVWKKTADVETNIGWGYDAWGNTESSSWGSIYGDVVSTLYVDTTEIIFDTTSVDIPSNFIEITISNNGESDITIENITVDNNNFIIDLEIGNNPIDQTPFLLPFGEFKTFGCRFYPKYAGNITGNIVISTNSNDINITLYGYSI
jgi:hypothetical protein